mmetsp:Transcript_3245/g.4937  ORF Transcript_3245/g.4937 Transcript_3245/m.4937 type:complete len:142 (+) Transcript_3245:230-655(+)
MTDMSVTKFQDKVDIKIVRSEGSDGRISCMIKTEQLLENNVNSGQNAIEFEDYLPKYDKVDFAHGENERVVSIMLVNNKQPYNEDKKIDGNKIDEDDEEDQDNEGVSDVMFKVKLEKAEPSTVKISKKNVCFVTILQNEEQ